MQVQEIGKVYYPQTGLPNTGYFQSDGEVEGVPAKLNGLQLVEGFHCKLSTAVEGITVVIVFIRADDKIGQPWQV